MAKSKQSYVMKDRRGDYISQYPLYLPVPLMEAIKQAAKDRRCTVASIVRQAIAIGLPRLGTDLPVAVNANNEEDSNELRRII